MKVETTENKGASRISAVTAVTDSKHWDRQARTFEAQVFNAFASDVKGRLAGLVKRLGSKKALVCDFGCGVGRAIPLLARHFGMVHAVDFSGQCLRRARKACAGLDNVRLVQEDLASCRTALCRADVGLSVNVLLDPDPDINIRIVRAMSLSLKPLGRLIVVVPALESVTAKYPRMLSAYVERGLSYSRAAAIVKRSAGRELNSATRGIVSIEGVPTRHFIREQAVTFFRRLGYSCVETDKLEYPWSEEGGVLADETEPPLPWDWLFVFRRVR
jgi:SAM-dependent methyltransferase